MSTTINDNNNPVWNYKQEVTVTYHKKSLDNYKMRVTVYDKDIISEDYIGQIEIPLSPVIIKPNKEHKTIHDLLNRKGKKLGSAQIEIELKFKPN